MIAAVIGAIALAGVYDCGKCAVSGLYEKKTKSKDNRGGYGPPFWMNEAQKEFWWKTHLRGGHTRRNKPLNQNAVRKLNHYV